MGLSVFLSAELGASVGDADVELPRALHDLLALARGHVVGDLRGVLPAEVTNAQRVSGCKSKEMLVEGRKRLHVFI